MKIECVFYLKPVLSIHLKHFQCIFLIYTGQRIWGKLVNYILVCLTISRSIHLYLFIEELGKVQSLEGYIPQDGLVT